MKLNNKGFAITSIVYAMLILFLVLILLIMSNMASRKALFDKEKSEVLNKLEEKLNLPLICQLVSGESKKVGSKYRCNLDNEERMFYVLENLEDSAAITLIMNKNISEQAVGWCDDEEKCKDENGNWTSVNGPITANAYLKEKSKEWIEKEQVLEVGIPTYNQIRKVNNSHALTNTPWLYENLDSDSTTPVLGSYWTAEPTGYAKWFTLAVYYSGQTNNAYVYYTGGDTPGDKGA